MRVHALSLRQLCGIAVGKQLVGVARPQATAVVAQVMGRAQVTVVGARYLVLWMLMLPYRLPMILWC